MGQKYKIRSNVVTFWKPLENIHFIIFFISDRIDLLLMQSGVIKLGECWFILSDQILSLNIIKTFLCLEKVEQSTWVCPGLIQWQVSLSQFVTLTWAQVTWWPHAISRIFTVKRKDSNSQYKTGSLSFLFIKLFFSKLRRFTQS